MIDDQVREEFQEQARAFFQDELAHDASEMAYWSREIQALRHLLLHAYAKGVMTGLQQVPGLRGRQIVDIFDALTQWPASEYEDDEVGDEGEGAAKT